MNDQIDENNSFLDDLKKSKTRIGIIALFLVGIFVLAVGLGLTFFKHKSASDDVQILSASTSSPQASTEEIIVHVDGAVVRPGVYHLRRDLRVDDAVKAAGGLIADADQSKINLAAKLVDGQKVHVLRVGESVSQSVGGSVNQQTGESVSQLISINNASLAELDKLPGIGPVTAAKIVASRPYSSLDDLLSKKAVTKSVYEKIKDMITL